MTLTRTITLRSSSPINHFCTEYTLLPKWFFVSCIKYAYKQRLDENAKAHPSKLFRGYDIFYPVVLNCTSDNIKKNEMGGACGAYRGGEGCTGFWWGNLIIRDHRGDPGTDGRIILRWIFRKWDVGYGLD